MIEHVLTYWQTGGPLMLMLAMVCFGIWFFYLRLRAHLLRTVRLPDHYADDLLKNLGTRSRAENLAHYAQANDLLSQAVSHVLEATQSEQSPGEAFDDFQNERLGRYRTDTLLLKACTAAAPLLGLLGTVIGMIATFHAVGHEAGNTAVQVSSGISQALITTQCGLVVAIPGFFGMARIRRLLSAVRVRLGACRIHLVFQLETAEHTS